MILTCDIAHQPCISAPGQLPYLQHGPHLISSLSSILVYLAKLSPESASLATSELTDVKSPTTSKSRGTDLDDDLSDGKRAEGVAWKAVIEGELADLVVSRLLPLMRAHQKGLELTSPALALDRASRTASSLRRTTTLSSTIISQNTFPSLRTNTFPTDSAGSTSSASPPSVSGTPPPPHPPPHLHPTRPTG